MNYYIAIDPGLSEVGLAILDDEGSLVHHDLVKVPGKQRTAEAFHTAAFRVTKSVITGLDFPPVVRGALFVERMKVYPHKDGDRKRVDPNDLLDLAYLSGAILGMFPVEYPDLTALELATAPEWKGQVPKKVMERRLRRDYGEEIKGMYNDYGRKAHNTVDALGMAVRLLREKGGG